MAPVQAGTLAAWGRNWSGQGQVPGWIQNPVAMAAGRNHNLFIQADGTVGGWGENNYGEASVPPEAQGQTVALAAGQSFSVVLLENGTVLTWGSLSGQPAEATNLPNANQPRLTLDRKRTRLNSSHRT